MKTGSKSSVFTSEISKPHGAVFSKVQGNASLPNEDRIKAKFANATNKLFGGGSQDKGIFGQKKSEPKEQLFKKASGAWPGMKKIEPKESETIEKPEPVESEKKLQE